MLIQTRMMARLMMLIPFPIMAVCLVALFIGAQNPTQLVTALTFSPVQSSSHITVFDMNRNLPLRIIPPNPVYESPSITLSPNGRWVVLVYGLMNPSLTMMVLDIFSGEVHYIDTSDCPNVISVPEWTPDSRQVSFTCFTSITVGYFFDVETHELTVTPSLVGYPSPDGSLMVSDMSSELVLTNIDGTNEQAITPPNVWGRFIAWETDGESLLFRGIDTIQRYTLATQSIEVLAEDVSIYQDMMLLSPDGQWLGMITGLSQPRAQVLHLPTSTFYDVSVVDEKNISAEWLNWSPDSNWLFIGGNDEVNMVHYVTKPDASMMQILIESPMQVQTGSTLLYMTLPQPEWLSGSQWLTYLTIFDNYLYMWRWDEAEGQYNLVKRIQNAGGQPIWMQNHDKLIFIQSRFDGNRLAYLDVNTGEIHFISPPLEIIGGYRLVE